MVREWFTRATRENNIFFYLLGYSWLSLLTPALALAINSPLDPIQTLVLAAAISHNLVLTILYPRLNRLVQQKPVLFGFDLLLSALFIALTGGTHSPYYLFALGPILAAAFLFQMSGGLAAAGSFTAMYILGIGIALVRQGSPIDPPVALSQIVSFGLIAVIFGYPSILLKRIQNTSAELARAHMELMRKNSSLECTNRELESIHSLGLAMQSSSVDVFDVQERILIAITGELDFERAMLGLVDPDRNVLMGWLTHRKSHWHEAPDGLFHTSEIALTPESGLIAQALLEGKPRYVTDAAPPTSNIDVNNRLGLSPYAILPLVMRDHSVGALIVDNPDSHSPISQESMLSLASVANQAALALGSTKLCIERAQRLAVEEERNRIAMEIHDTASQSLFGIVYALDACIKLLPGNPQEVKDRLADTRGAAQRTMTDLRRSVYDIWVGRLNNSEFVDELRSHLLKLEAPGSLSVDIQVEGNMDLLNNFTRRNLLRIAEEGIANIVKHSQATQASVEVNISPSNTSMTIQDNGRGFDQRDAQSNGFGLKSIRERAREIGAEMKLDSQAGKGTRLEIALESCSPPRGQVISTERPSGRADDARRLAPMNDQAWV